MAKPQVLNDWGWKTMSPGHSGWSFTCSRKHALKLNSHFFTSVIIFPVTLWAGGNWIFRAAGVGLKPDGRMSGVCGSLAILCKSKVIRWRSFGASSFTTVLVTETGVRRRNDRSSHFMMCKTIPKCDSSSSMLSILCVMVAKSMANVCILSRN